MKYEEFTIGQVFDTKSFEVTKDEIMSFASEFDPQYMHLDEEKAKQGIYNGIIASGLHTVSISFKLLVEQDIFGDDVIAGIGMDKIRYLKAVYPGDQLQTIVEVTGKKTHKEESGVITLRLSTYNQKNEKVFRGDLSALVKRSNK